MLRVRNYFIAFAVVFAISSAYALIGIQDAKAQAAGSGVAYADLIKRIEALESNGGGNVTTGARGLKIGFNIRHRFELRDDNGGNKNSATSDFTLQRIRLSFDADVNKNVRAFIKLQDSRTFGVEGFAGNGTVGNLARVDLNEAYVELRNLGDLSSVLENVSVKIGRWQWFYGEHRLIGTLNWANQSRSYDGARIRWQKDKNWVDVFAASIEEDQTGGVAGEEDGLAEMDELFWGLYSNFRVTDGLDLQPYFIIRNRSRDADASRGPGAAGEQRYTAGARIAGSKIPSLPGVDFSLEQAWQFGRVEPTTYRSTDIDAFGGAWGAGYTFSNVPWSPRIGYKFVYASGDDDTADRDAETFSQLYPTGHARLGYIDFHGWQNIEAHKIEFSAKPSKKLLLKADLWFFENNEENDSWYTVGGGPRGGFSAAQAKAASTNRDDTYGQELDLVFKYKLFKNFSVVGGYSRYFVDDFIEDSVNGGVGGTLNNDSDTDWVWLQTTVKF